MTELPSGTVTFLLTDIEGSTALWERDPGAMRVALARHDALLTAGIEAHRGRVVKSRGEGDSVFAVFARASDAVAAASDLQRALQAEPWPTDRPLRVRMALHTGEAELRDGDYYGAAVNRCARLRAAGHGGQVLVSGVTAELVWDALPNGTSLRDLGEHRLHDLTRPEHVFQLWHPDLVDEFPTLKTLEARPHNLPVLRTPLIGREWAVAAARERLLGGDVGLLTFTGPGGTGKTRLALQVAAELLDAFADGVFFVPLAPIRDPAVVPSAIAGVLGVQEGAGRPLRATLMEYLRDKRLLLLLDNFEQILPAAPFVSELLQGCPHLKVLVTSRALLHVYGEHDFPVPPLMLPDRGSPQAVERLTQYEAVRLFIERAQAVRPGFAVTTDNAPAVAEICHRLEGLPLAIELAAARVRLLAPQAILTRLERRLPLLTGGAQDLPQRQQTLRGTIGWSYDLLTAEEQALFRRLSVFFGGCTLEAVEAVCNPDADLDVFEGVASLVDKSLLRQTDGPGGEPRFWMLETIREYGLEQLEACGEAAATRRRHAEYYLGLAEDAEWKLWHADQPLYLARLEQEHDNLRAVLAWSQSAAGDVETGLRAAGALAWFWFIRGYFSEGRRWLAQLIAASSGRSSLGRAKALNGAGNLANRQGEYGLAVALLEQSLAMCRELRSPMDVTFALNNLGMAEYQRGNYGRATPFFEEALTLYRDLGEQPHVARTLGNLGIVARAEGQLERAAALHEQTLAISRQIAHRDGIGWALTILGGIAKERGDYERATAHLEESLDVYRKMGHKWRIGMALRNLGDVAQYQGDSRRAAAYYQECLRLYHELGDRLGAALCLAGLAEVAGVDGLAERAARLCGAAQAMLDSTGAPLEPADRVSYERHLGAVRVRLDPEGFAAGMAHGQAMPPEQAVAYALEEAAPA